MIEGMATAAMSLHMMKFRERIYRSPDGREGKMERRVLYFVLLLVVGLFLFVGYNSYDTKHGAAAGKANSKDPATVVLKTEPVVTTPATESTVDPPTSLPAVPSVATTPAISENAQNNAQQAKDRAAGGDLKPPSGSLFSGVGRYQLYRQGDITWRLDTETGKTCIVFATDEEWTKPRVFHNGCAKR